MRHQLAAAFLAVPLLLGATEAVACACCSNPGQRIVESMALDEQQRELLKSLRFAPKAELYMTEAGSESYQGIDSEQSQYSLKAVWQGNTLVLSLDDGHGFAGTLSLPLPGKISIFEIDPRNAPDTGVGPRLYKEWKVTGKPSGTGKFASSGGAGQLLTLIAQGGGINCTSAEDFTHWSLVMQGPKANYMFFGQLVK